VIDGYESIKHKSEDDLAEIKRNSGGEFICNSNLSEIVEELNALGTSDILIGGDNDVLALSLASCNKPQIINIMVYMCNHHPDETEYKEKEKIITFWWD
jgi:hypothetical protein